MHNFTEHQTHRQTLELDKQELRRLLADPIANAESISAVKRNIDDIHLWGPKLSDHISNLVSLASIDKIGAS